MHTTGWSSGLEVSGGGRGVVSHAGLVLLRHLADKTGLTGGLSRALATPRFLVHDRGRVTADLACAIADGARVISDFRVMSDQRELFGLVASVPTAWRTLQEIARGGARADRRITAAVNLIVTTVSSFGSMMPQTSPSAKMARQNTAVQNAPQEKAVRQNHAIINGSDLKRQWNQQVCAPSGNAMLDAALSERALR